MGYFKSAIEEGRFHVLEAKMEFESPTKFTVEVDPPKLEVKNPLCEYQKYNRGYEDGIDATLDALDPVHIIYNPPATIVFWGNGEKTVVKCSKNEKFNKYHGFCAAVAKRLFENNSQVTKLVNAGIEESPVKKSKKSKETKKK